MMQRWWNVDYWEERAAQPGRVTALGWGTTALLLYPAGANRRDVEATVAEMRRLKNEPRGPANG